MAGLQPPGMVDGEHRQPVRANLEHTEGPEGSAAPHQGQAGTRMSHCSPTRAVCGPPMNDQKQPGPSALEGPLDECLRFPNRDSKASPARGKSLLKVKAK